MNTKKYNIYDVVDNKYYTTSTLYILELGGVSLIEFYGCFHVLSKRNKHL